MLPVLPDPYIYSDTTIAIQGRDCLIQKFRNSSVMLEPSHYRPKVRSPSSRPHCICSDCFQLFYTLHNGSQLAGQEEDFPSSDNASKLKRSCENAEHVGKFRLLASTPYWSWDSLQFRTICSQRRSTSSWWATPSSFPIWSWDQLGGARRVLRGEPVSWLWSL